MNNSILHVWQAAYPWDVRVSKINQTLIENNYQVHVAARTGNEKEKFENFKNEKIHRIGFGRKRILSTPLPWNPLWKNELGQLAKEIKPKIIIARDIAIAIPAFKVAEKYNAKKILDLAELYPEAMRTWDKYRKNIFLNLAVHQLKIPDYVEKKAVLNADGILVVCEEMKTRLINQFSIDENKICLVQNTPSLSQWKNFTRGSDQAKPFRFGYHGILCEDRELEIILKGFDLAAEKNHAITLTLAGGGESEEKLKNLRQTLKNKDRIILSGRYKPDDLPKLYSECDFGIVSLKVNEFTNHTLANKFFDYACLGKPFIFSDAKPLVSVMKKMKSGISFQGGNIESAANAFLNILELNYEEASKNGILSVQNEYNWSVDLKRMLDFLK